ncbi:MAG: carbohydrate-binding domain-containing protein [Bacteroidales bacterium]|nr:carbohydrate-binding domain-containing protein [Bacteroidales bacterium]
MKRFPILILSLLLTAGIVQAQNVSVVYSGTTATVTTDSIAALYLTVTQSGAHVSIAQSSDLATEITYTLSGSSTDGEFYMSGSYKATIELNGLTLTNATPVYSGAAVHIQNGKRINVKVVSGTTNTLVDAASGSQKGCLYIKGHAEFKQQGTLNVTGNVKHGIKAGEYVTLKNATLNITSAVGDGISCNQYFLMQSGSVNISGTGDDGIQCDLEDSLSTGETVDHEDEDSGNIYISGGTITIACAATAAKGIKGQGDINTSGGTITVTTTGDGEWDSDDLETKAACGLSCDGNMNITGGTLNLSATGSGGKGMKCDGVMTIADGSVTVTTSGGLYYNNGTTENTNYTGNTDNVSSNYYSSPKGIKAGLKTQNGSSYTYSGGLVVGGGNVKVTTSGRNGEGMESKNYLNISGGEIYINSYDDAINSAQDLTISGGYVYAHASNNDGMDANGNFYINGGLVYAIGASSPEVALDANTEEQKQLHIDGGVVIAVGGIEQGSSVTQPHASTSSVSGNTWYTTSYGSDAVAFLTPTLSGSGGGPGGGGPGGGGPGGGGPGGGGPGGGSYSIYVSALSTPSISNGNNVSGGSALFEGNCYVSYLIDTSSSCVVYDTVTVTVYDTVTVTIYDTVRITVSDTVTTTVITYDTTSLTVYDTMAITVYDTVDVSLCDTVYITLPADTIYIYDTVYICDTIYITQEGIGGIDALNLKLYQQGGQVVVEGADGNRVWLYDVTGRLLATRQDEHSPLRFDIPASGVYLLKVGSHTTKRIVVIR